MIFIIIALAVIILVSVIFSFSKSSGDKNNSSEFNSSKNSIVEFIKNNFDSDVSLITNEDECENNNKDSPCLKNSSDIYMNLCPYGMKFTNGTCIDDFSTENNNCISQLITNKNTNLGKVGLYWGGVVGQAVSDASGDTMTQYFKNVLEFCLTPSKNRSGRNRVDVLYFVLEHWQNNSFGFLDPKVNWMQNVALPMIKKKANGKLEVGVVAYMNPKDAIWDYDLTLPGGLNSTNQDFRSCNPTNPNGGCPVTDYSICSITGSCQIGCPNYASQVMKYIGEINKNSDVKITYFIMDGEDAGGYQSPNGFCFLQHAKEIYAPDIKYIGMAKGIGQTTVEDNKYPNILYPETYWYMNELAPCHGSPFELQNKSDICTEFSSYRRFQDKPLEYLDFLKQASCNDKDSLGLTKISNNLKNNKDAIWPMFSIENLSIKAPANNCLAREFHPASIPGKPQMCGTFDGFSYWSWDEFEKFLILFSQQFGAPNVAIYEAQFLPPHWFKNNKFPFPYSKPSTTTVKPKPGCQNKTNKKKGCPCLKSWDCQSQDCSGIPPTCQ